jgi:hypothetical protein
VSVGFGDLTRGGAALYLALEAHGAASYFPSGFAHAAAFFHGQVAHVSVGAGCQLEPAVVHHRCGPTLACHVCNVRHVLARGQHPIKGQFRKVFRHPLTLARTRASVQRKDPQAGVPDRKGKWG